MPRVRLAPKFKKNLKKKPPRMQGAIVATMKRLEEDPRHPGLQVHRIQGQAGVWEAYVDDANRVTFHWDGPVLVLRNNCNHDLIKRAP